MEGLDGESQRQTKVKVDHGEQTQQLAKNLIQVGVIKKNRLKGGDKKMLIQMEVDLQVLGEKQRMMEALQVEVVGELPRMQVLQVEEVVGERLKMTIVLQMEEGLRIKDGETIMEEIQIHLDGEQQIMMLLGHLEEDGEIVREEEVETIKETEEDLITIMVEEDIENLIEITIIMKETMEIDKEVDLSVTIARMEVVVVVEDGKITIMKDKQVVIRKEIVKIMNLVEVGRAAVMILAVDGGIIITKVKEIITTIVAVED